MGDVTDYYWSCECKEDVIRGWFEDRCKRCGLGISEGRMVEWLQFPQDHCRTPLGGFYNHSDNPNCELVGDNIKRLVTMMEVKCGEEITCRYTLYELNGGLKEPPNNLFISP